jgi:peptidoglycan-associated lipoprotein
MIAWRHHVRGAALSGSRRGAEAPALLALLIAGLAVGAAGCHKKVPPPAPAPPPPAATPAPPPPSTPPPAAPAPAPAPNKLTEEEAFARKSLDELNAEHPLADVFFDLDRSEIRQDAHAPLQKDAEWLGKWKSTKITVEGHCDSRGSSEYNLALGSRRADAVKAYLANLGVAPDRMTVISKGKEQPFCREENESCWQQNRRGHFLVTGK